MKKSFITFMVVCLAIVSTGCKSQSSANDPGMLTSVAEWEVSSINGNTPIIEQYNRGLPTIGFTKDNKVTGHGGCNRYSGEYTLEGDKLTLGRMLSTKMFCEGGGEDAYMKALGTASSYKATKNKLVLLSAGTDEVLVFVPKKS